MSNSRMNTIRESLEHEYDLADAECQRTKAEWEAAEKDRKSIREALVALGGKPKKRGSKKASAAKPALKNGQVLRLIASLLDARGPMSVEDLKGTVKESLAKNNVRLEGFDAQFSEALQDERLSVDGSNVLLAESAFATR